MRYAIEYTKGQTWIDGLYYTVLPKSVLRNLQLLFYHKFNVFIAYYRLEL